MALTSLFRNGWCVTSTSRFQAAPGRRQSSARNAGNGEARLERKTKRRTFARHVAKARILHAPRGHTAVPSSGNELWGSETPKQRKISFRGHPFSACSTLNKLELNYHETINNNCSLHREQGSTLGPHSDQSVFDLAARPAGSRKRAAHHCLAKGTRGPERAHHNRHCVKTGFCVVQFIATTARGEGVTYKQQYEDALRPAFSSRY